MQRTELINALSACNAIIKSSSLKPVLQYALQAGNELIATNLETSLRVTLSEGHAVNRLLPVSRLLAFLRASNAEDVGIESSGSGLVVRCGRSSIKLPTESPDDFPTSCIPEMPSRSVTVPGPALRRALSLTMFSLDPLSNKYALGGVNFSASGGLRLVGTDGRRMSLCSIECKCDIPSSVVPVEVLKLIERSSCDTIELAFTHAAVVARLGGTTISGRLIEGRFPTIKLDGLIKPDYERVAIPCDSFLRCVEQVAVATSGASGGVDLAFSAGELSLSSSAADVGEASASLPIPWVGKARTTMLGVKYLAQVLRAIGSDVVEVRVTDGETPVVFECGDYTHIIMPMVKG